MLCLPLPRPRRSLLRLLPIRLRLRLLSLLALDLLLLLPLLLRLHLPGMRLLLPLQLGLLFALRLSPALLLQPAPLPLCLLRSFLPLLLFDGPPLRLFPRLLLPADLHLQTLSGALSRLPHGFMLGKRLGQRSLMFSLLLGGFQVQRLPKMPVSVQHDFAEFFHQLPGRAFAEVAVDAAAEGTAVVAAIQTGTAVRGAEAGARGTTSRGGPAAVAGAGWGGHCWRGNHRATRRR